MPFKTQEAKIEDGLLCFWFGFSALLVFLQLWHLFLPINIAAASIAILAGTFGHLATRAGMLTAIWRAFKNTPRWCQISMMVITVWMANRATAAPDFFDSGNYHFPVIRWVTTYPIVKGLGNIDGHLALNNVSLLYQGLLEIGFLRSRSAHIGNGVLLLTVLLFFIFQITRALTIRQYGRPALFALPLLTILVFWMPSISTPNTDLPSGLMLLVVSYCLVTWHSPNHAPESAEALAFRVVAIAGLCAEALAVKLSAAVYAGCGFFVFLCLWLAVRSATIEYRIRITLVAATVAAASIVLWAIRNVLLSGYPFFPWLALKFPVPWRVPDFYAEWYGWWIRAFARGSFRSNVSGDGSSWIRHWMSGDLLSAKIEAILPLLLVLLSCTYLSGRILQRRLRVQYSHRLLIWLPVVVSLLFWFCSAPSLRFGSVLLWILAAQAISVAVQHALYCRQRFGVLAMQVLLLMPMSGIIQQFGLIHQARHGLLGSMAASLWVAPGPDHGLHPTHVNRIEAVMNANGVIVYYPDRRTCLSGGWPDCVAWYGPQPAPLWHGPKVGPVIKENLRYLSPPDPGGGFAIDDTEQRWLSSHSRSVQRMAQGAGVNMQRLTYYFQVGPDVIRAALSIVPE